MTTVQDIFGADGMLAKHRPGYEERPQQTTFALAVEAALKSRTHLTAEAGTGTGKSYAYTVPAIESGQRTVISTAVLALQEQLRDKDLPTLAGIYRDVRGQQVRYAVLKGLGNYTCLRNVARQEEDLMGGAFKSVEAGQAFPAFAEWVHQQERDGGLAEVDSYPGTMPWELKTDVTTDSDGCTGQKCPMFTRCFGREAKARAADAQIVVVNHALLLRDLAVRAATESHASSIPDYATLIIDECHEFESIARDNLGIEMTVGSLLRLVQSMEKLTTEHKTIKNAGTLNQGASTEQTDQAYDWVIAVRALVDQVLGWMDLVRARFGPDDTQQRLGDERGARISPEDPPIEQVIDGFKALSVQMTEGTPAWLEDEEREQWKKLGQRVVKAAGNLQTIVTPGQDDTWIRYATLENGANGQPRLTLASKPIDVAPILHEWLFDHVTIQRVKRDKETGMDVPVGDEMPPLAVIATSATVAADGNCGAWRKRVGCHEASELVVGSPFNYRQNARLYLPNDAYAFEPKGGNHEASGVYLDRIAAEMQGLTLDAKGGAFLLFTSGRAMRETYKRIADPLRLSGLTVMMQGEMSRTEMVSRFRTDGNAVILGLKSFWAGVDIPGDALRLVVIDKLPFNSPGDVVWSALCDYVNRQAGDSWAWWNELAVPFMIVMLNQGYGRLIRTMSDVGVVAILDGRLRTKGYGKRIIRSLPPAPVIGSAQEVQAFWAQARQGR